MNTITLSYAINPIYTSVVPQMFSAIQGDESNLFLVGGQYSFQIDSLISDERLKEYGLQPLSFYNNHLQSTIEMEVEPYRALCRASATSFDLATANHNAINEALSGAIKNIGLATCTAGLHVTLDAFERFTARSCNGKATGKKQLEMLCFVLFQKHCKVN